MWDQLKAIFALLGRLLTFNYRRRAIAFDEILKPLFERFLNIRSIYNELFITTIRRIPDMSPRGMLLHDKPIDAGKVERQIERVKKRYEKMRERDIHMRDRLRRECKEIMSAVNTIEEKRFLAGVMFYFAEDGPVAPKPRTLDFYIGLIEQQGGDHTFRSPSLFVQERISQVDDPAELHRIVNEHRNLLNQKFSDVCSAFTKLHLAVTRQRI